MCVHANFVRLIDTCRQDTNKNNCTVVYTLIQDETGVLGNQFNKLQAHYQNLSFSHQYLLDFWV